MSELPLLPPVDYLFINVCENILRSYNFINGKFEHVEIGRTELVSFCWKILISCVDEMCTDYLDPIPFPGLVPFVKVSNFHIMKSYIKIISPVFKYHGIQIYESCTQNDGFKRCWCILLKEPSPLIYTEERNRMLRLPMHDIVPFKRPPMYRKTESRGYLRDLESLPEDLTQISSPSSKAIESDSVGIPSSKSNDAAEDSDENWNFDGPSSANVNVVTKKCRKRKLNDVAENSDGNLNFCNESLDYSESQKCKRRKVSPKKNEVAVNFQAGARENLCFPIQHAPHSVRRSSTCRYST